MANCGSGCTGSCKGSCNGDCNSACGNNGCSGGCGNQCGGCGGSNCTSGCKGTGTGATSTCTSTCVGICEGVCKTGCSNLCQNTCFGCSGNCGGACGSGCSGGCSDGCTGGNVTKVYDRVKNLSLDQIIYQSQVNDILTLAKNEAKRRGFSTTNATISQFLNIEPKHFDAIQSNLNTAKSGTITTSNKQYNKILATVIQKMKKAACDFYKQQNP